MLCGILPLYKPAGPSSNDVLRKISRWIQVRSLGHSGTLDPMAEGLLVAAIDRATPVLPFLPSGKAYRAKITLGVTTDTWDACGQVVEQKPVPVLTPGEVAECLTKFTGTIQQKPPTFSALWHEGARLYKLARQGRAVQKPAREVTIFDLRLRDYQAPVVELEMRCSPGTYVRSLAMDLGVALGCGAHLSQLVRTACSGFELSAAVPLATFREEGPNGNWRRHLVSPAQALAHLPAVQVSEAEALNVYHGVRFPWGTTPAVSPEGWLRLLDNRGRLLAVATFDRGWFRFERVFHFSWDEA
jgi:tRNA pseudouridine55 synthase